MESTDEITIVIPVYNDWRSFRRLVEDLEVACREKPFRLAILAIDDGSSSGPEPITLEPRNKVRSIRVVELSCNLGHQRAIAVGLCVAVGSNPDTVVVMDADGEDQPQDVFSLVEASNAQQCAVVAQRGKRRESAVFIVMYLIYRVVFLILTGKMIHFGNFCALPERTARRLTNNPDTWNHLAGALVRSRTPLGKIRLNRGTRYHDRGKMNLTSLVVHGLSAMAVFSDTVFVRLLLLSTLLLLVSALGIAGVVATRLLTDLAIPGWATSAGGLLVVLLVQAALLILNSVFLLLSSRSAMVAPPARSATDYIAREYDLLSPG